MPRYFYLAEAERLIPRLEELLRDAVALKSEYASAGQALRTLSERVMLMGGMMLRREDSLALKSRRDAAEARLREVIERIQETGCVVKDLDTGLIDFPTFFEGNEVCLCWKLGETAIQYWHGLEEGFAGRKPIDGDFRERHQGGLPQ
jgi:hypothetical protein